MAKIADIKKGNTTLYPRTVAQAVAVSGNTLDEELSKKANTEDLVFAKGEGDYSQASYYSDSGIKTQNIATVKYSHAEGAQTTASAQCAHSEGYNNVASGIASHSEGSNNVASENYSHAEGYEATASGTCSHAEGYGATASGNWSHAEGRSTSATNASEHAEGEYNNSTKSTEKAQKTLHSVGNGNSSTERHNAVEIKFNGDYYIQEKTTTDDSTLKTYEAPMKRLQTWLNEKADKTEVPDIQVNSTSIVENGVANIPIASSTRFGVIKEWVGTQAEFDALTTLDENTNYYVV